MTREQIYGVWAPPASVWSPWVKPVAFAHLRPEADVVVHIPELDFDMSWANGETNDTAIVVDLPNAYGVLAGLALALQGFRPVPLYNAAPAPRDLASSADTLGSEAGLSNALVQVRPILAAIIRGTDQLQALKLSYTAPPAFLLDANRRGGGVKGMPGQFDNRSISFPTDFPSAAFLLSRGITRAVLLKANTPALALTPEVQPDLAQTLRRWQDAGIAIQRKKLHDPSPPEPITVPRASRLRELAQRLVAIFSLERHPLGGYGGTLAEHSSGGGSIG